MTASTTQDLWQKHRSKLLLVDSNLLLVYFVGSYDLSLLSRFDRTRAFTRRFCLAPALHPIFSGGDDHA